MKMAPSFPGALAYTFLALRSEVDAIEPTLHAAKPYLCVKAINAPLNDIIFVAVNQEVAGIVARAPIHLSIRRANIGYFFCHLTNTPPA